MAYTGFPTRQIRKYDTGQKRKQTNAHKHMLNQSDNNKFTKLFLLNQIFDADNVNFLNNYELKWGIRRTYIRILLVDENIRKNNDCQYKKRAKPSILLCT